jgi:uncharacterized protein YecE (DUF72 family)
MRIHVGTSGYNYPEWRGHFYPSDLPAKSMFAFYAARFLTVENNYTFYRMPTEATAVGWREQAPDGFQYTLKAPRRITHILRLADAAGQVAALCDAARALGPARGPLLFQLPPTFRRDTERLRAFVALLPAEARAAFEFRHDSWFDEEVYDVLRAGGAALCVADHGDRVTPLVSTARHGYFRLRDEGYGPDDLVRWADTIRAKGDVWDDVFVYFKHEDEGKGPEFARVFLEALGAPLTPETPRPETPPSSARPSTGRRAKRPR